MSSPPTPPKSGKSPRISAARAISYLVPYLAAVGLMILALIQEKKIAHLRSELGVQSAAVNRLSASDSLRGMRLVALDAKDPDYATAQVLIAWDPNRNRGIVSLEDLPTAPAGHEYRLWVLDPSAAAPIGAGPVSESRSFTAPSVNNSDPGFALSLEAGGGVAEPAGPILFAVAPGP